MNQFEPPSNKKGMSGWLKGCLIGCAGIIVLNVVGGIVAWQVAHRAMNVVQRLSDSVDDVTREFGDIDDYVIADGGRISAERIEAFLAVRESMRDELDELESALSELSDVEKNGFDGGVLKVFDLMGAGIRLLPRGAAMIQARSEAQLEHELGLGEYMFLYQCAFFILLDNGPAEGPPFIVFSDDGSEDDEEDLSEEEIRAHRDVTVRREFNRHGRTWVENAIAAAVRTGSDGWLATLETELDALESDRRRLLFESGLPEELLTSLSPYRSEFADSWRSLTNAVEIGITFD